VFIPEMKLGHRVSVSDPVFDLILSFNMHVYRGAVAVTAE